MPQRSAEASTHFGHWRDERRLPVTSHNRMSAIQLSVTRPALAAVAPRPMAPGPVGLAQRIAERTACVAVVGQGYVGFPLAQAVARAGFRTYGFDTATRTAERCQRENRAPAYRAGTSADPLAESDVIVIAVPTPTRNDNGVRSPDLSYVVSALATVGEFHRSHPRPRLLILECTYAPGTTRELVRPLVAQAHAAGMPLVIGYSPERIDPGHPEHSLCNTPKIVSGYDAGAAALVEDFYAAFIPQTARASSMESAEAAKMLENAFRFVNITFAQEFDDYCEAAGMSAREITALAGTKPFGFMPFYAGPGIGGHCIAEDPYFLRRAMAEAGTPAGILDAAMANHESRAEVIVERIARRLAPRPMPDARVLLLGVTYKANVGDTRMSPADPIREALIARGATVDYHDPYVDRWHRGRSVDLAMAAPGTYDLTVVVTHHSTLDLCRLRAAGWRLYDISAGPDEEHA